MSIKEKITSLLDELKIIYTWEEHPPVYTVEESLAHLNGRQPIKNLLLTDRKKTLKILVIMSGEPRLDTKKLAANLGVPKLQFTNPDMLKDTLGVEPGSVSLFGLLHEGSKGVKVVIDQSLMEHPEVGFHPNDNSATIFIHSKDIEKIVEATGHKYEFKEL